MIALGAGLRAAREERGYRLRALAGQLDLEPPAVSMIELGHRPPTAAYVARVLGFLAVDKAEYRRLMALVQNLELSNWVDTSAYPDALIDYERNATTFLLWAPRLFPNLVRTPDYTREVLDTGLLTSDEIDQSLMLHLVRRDAALARENPATVTILLGERTLHHKIEAPGVRQAQLQYLLMLIEEGRITVRIIPGGGPPTPTPDLPFTLMHFRARNPVVSVCQDHFHVYLTEPAAVTRHKNAADRLLARALHPPASRALIASVLASAPG
ncbi:helix-turn-helix domain-containing protein [Amycolatopsis samaneae]|uniref:Helix-turn-helix transcriptional regulator n=1 Tax=Amycolatopsis samaneae TaxID=664691 RepID=A0ABW5GKC4_9PSEU